MKYLPFLWPKFIPKLKVLRIYWNLANSIFQICQYRFWCQKWFLWNTYLLLAQIGPRKKIAQGLLKFGTFDISNIPILILMSKINFIKYLPLLWPKLVLKWKMIRIYWSLTHSIFQICKSEFWSQKWSLWNVYQLPDQINSKIKTALKCLFDISSILILTTRSDKSFSEQLLHIMPKLVSKFKFQSRL